MKKILLITLLVFPSLFSQTIDWKLADGTLRVPIYALGISPTGEVFAGGLGSVFVLDTLKKWGGSSQGITANGIEAAGFGFSSSVQFVSFFMSNGIFRSTDNGKTWNKIPLTISNIVMKFLCKGDTMYGLTRNRAVYWSTDRGDTWTVRTVLPGGTIIFDGGFLADTSLGLATNKGLYRTNKSGAGFLLDSMFLNIECRAIDVTSSGTVYLVTNDSIYLSDSNVQQWSVVQKMPEDSCSKMFISDTTLFAFWREPNILFRLSNGEWQLSMSGLEGTSVTDLAKGLRGENYVSTLNGVFQWNKNSLQWIPVSNGFKDDIVSTFSIEPGNVYVGIKNKGVYRANIFDMLWKEFNSLSKNPKSVYAASPLCLVFDSAAIYRTTDGGSTWNISNAVVGKGALSYTLSGTLLFIGLQNDGIYLSTNMGETWMSRSSGLNGKDITSLITIRDSTLLAGSSDGLYKTTNNGLNWIKVSSLSSVSSLFRTPTGVLYASTANGPYNSTDEGISWGSVNSLTGTVHNFSGDMFLLSAASTDGLFLSTNSGVTWKNYWLTGINNSITLLDKVIAATDEGIYSGIFRHNNAPEVKWLTVGSLHNWFSSFGSEVEEGLMEQLQYGWQWPAIIYRQDMQVSKGLWIGSKNFQDIVSGSRYNHKVVSVGPRMRGLGEFFPISLSMKSKFAPPKVLVNGSPSFTKTVANDSIDITQKADRMIVNEFLTSNKVLIRRNVFQFSQQYHDNYIILDYTFRNVNTDTLRETYFYFLYRWGINALTRYVIGNPTGWGINTMLDQRGDGLNPGSTFFPGNKDNDIRSVYAWHGNYPPFTLYDNIGGPVWKSFYTMNDTMGRLGASQFVGVATLHADSSPADTTDDMMQPSTMSYESSDHQNTLYHDQYDADVMTSKYAWMSKGRALQRHADIVGEKGDPSMSTPGGFSAGIGYGPYTLAPGDSIHIVLVEAASGLNIDAAKEIGKAYKKNQLTPITYRGVTKTKNEWVYTGRDSIFQTFRRAMANYHSGYNIPSPPDPPKSFSVSKSGNVIVLEWDVYKEDDPKIKGFEIYRAEEQEYDTYKKIASCHPLDRSFVDSMVVPGVSYYYYIVSVGDSMDNTGIGLTPLGRLQSNQYYTQTYDPVGIPTSVNNKSEVPAEYVLSQNFPNPFNPSTTIAFQIPRRGFVTLKVYDVLGKEITTLVQEERSAGRYTVRFDASSLASGLYFYRLRSDNNVSIKKMILMK
ncbi:MAG: T9SS type A sorting domain-containing protein [Bacteroidota bacterium]